MLSLVTRWRFVCILPTAKLRCHVRPAGHEQQPPGLSHLIFRISIVFKEKEADTKRYPPLFGDPLEIRTPDPLLKRQLLCQLS